MKQTHVHGTAIVLKPHQECATIASVFLNICDSAANLCSLAIDERTNRCGFGFVLKAIGKMKQEILDAENPQLGQGRCQLRPDSRKNRDRPLFRMGIVDLLHLILQS